MKPWKHARVIPHADKDDGNTEQKYVYIFVYAFMTTENESGIYGSFSFYTSAFLKSFHISP